MNWPDSYLDAINRLIHIYIHIMCVYHVYPQLLFINVLFKALKYNTRMFTSGDIEL